MFALANDVAGCCVLLLFLLLLMLLFRARWRRREEEYNIKVHRRPTGRSGERTPAHHEEQQQPPSVPAEQDLAQAQGLPRGQHKVDLSLRHQQGLEGLSPGLESKPCW